MCRKIKKATNSESRASVAQNGKKYESLTFSTNLLTSPVFDLFNILGEHLGDARSGNFLSEKCEH